MRLPAAMAGRTGTVLLELALAAVLVWLLVGLLVQGALVGVAWAALVRTVEDTARSGALCLNRPEDPCTVAALAATLCSSVGGVDRRTLTGTVATDGTRLLVSLTVRVPVVVPGGGDPLPVGAVATRPLLFPGGRDVASPTCT